MKLLIIAASMFFCSNCFSQKDTLIIPNGGIKVNPVLFLTDSAYSIGWMVSKISSDTTLDSYGEIYIYKKNGTKIAEYGFPIPRQIINNWGTDNSSIDDFIFNKFPNFKKQTKK
jgi:hypothetical protein